MCFDLSFDMRLISSCFAPEGLELKRMPEAAHVIALPYMAGSKHPSIGVMFWE